MTKIKIAVVGIGKVAQGNYLPFLSKQADVDLGLYSRTAAKTKDCAARFGAIAFETLDELAAWDPDSVLILTMENDRFEAASAVLAHKPRRIFFEKPLTARLGQENVRERDFHEGRQLLNLAREAGSETAMVFNYRFFEHSARAARIVAERDFGAVLNVTGLVHYACWSHAIDLVHFLAGPLSQISALQGEKEYPWGSRITRDVTAAFRTAQGATGTLIGTSSLAWTFPLYQLTFNFEHGRIQMQDLDGELVVMDARGTDIETYRISADRSRWDMYNRSFEQSLAAYLDSIRKNAPPPVPGELGLLELQVEAGIKRSIAQRRPVELEQEFPISV